MCVSMKVHSPFDLLLRLYPFVLDGVHCASIVSFFQAVKFKEENERIYVCQIAKEDDVERIRDIGSVWMEEQVLYWKGKACKRNSAEYQQLIEFAFSAAYLHPEFQKVLIASDDSFLSDIQRKNEITQTPLTRREATYQFLRLKGDLIRFTRSAIVTIPFKEVMH